MCKCGEGHHLRGHKWMVSPAWWSSQVWISGGAISWKTIIAIHANHNSLVIGCLAKDFEGHAMPPLPSIDNACSLVIGCLAKDFEGHGMPSLPSIDNACFCSVVPYSDDRSVKQQRTLQTIQGIGSDPVFDPAKGTKEGCSSANPSPDVNRIGDLCISSLGSVNWVCKMTEYTKQCDYKNDLCYLPGMHQQVAPALLCHEGDDATSTTCTCHEMPYIVIKLLFGMPCSSSVWAWSITTVWKV